MSAANELLARRSPCSTSRSGRLRGHGLPRAERQHPRRPDLRDRVVAAARSCTTPPARRPRPWSGVARTSSACSSTTSRTPTSPPSPPGSWKPRTSRLLVTLATFEAGAGPRARVPRPDARPTEQGRDHRGQPGERHLAAHGTRRGVATFEKARVGWCWSARTSSPRTRSASRTAVGPGRSPPSSPPWATRGSRFSAARRPVHGPGPQRLPRRAGPPASRLRRGARRFHP